MHGKAAGTSNPMRIIAQEVGLPIFEPEDINSVAGREAIERLSPELMVVCDYGQILAPETLALARLGGINLHASLLPKYRGAAPINWAIYRGEAETGITVIHMTPRVDAGPALAQAATPIDPDETAVELEIRLAELGAPIVLQTIEDLAAGCQQALPQDPALATKARRLKKTDGLIDWRMPARQIKNQVRGMEPWPKTYTFWQRTAGAPMRLILGKVDALADSEAIAPGVVIQGGGGSLVIAAGEGAIRILQIQPAGKRMLSAEEFLLGYSVKPGDRFGPEDV